MWVATTGMCAWAIAGVAGLINAPMLVLLDYWAKPWSIEVLNEIAARMDEEAEAALANNKQAAQGNGIGCCLLVPAQLQKLAIAAMAKAFGGHDERRLYYRNRRMAVDALEDSWLSDLAGTMLSATAVDRIKLSPRAAEKAAGTPLLGILSIKPGEDIAADPLRLALMILFAQLGPRPRLPKLREARARMEVR